MKKSRLLLLSGTAIFSICLPCCSKSTQKNVIKISFGEKDCTGIPNLKKFDFFSSDWSWSGYTPASLDRDMLTAMPALSETKSQTLRTVMGMGETYKGIGYNIGRNGNFGLTDEEYGPVLEILKELQNNKVQPYLSICYSPECVLDGGNWKSAPNPTKYQIFTKNVETVLERNNINAILEIMNEPDNLSFFTSKWSDYVDNYIAGYKGIKSVNNDRVVVGPSLAYVQNAATHISSRLDMDNKEIDDVSYFLERAFNENAFPDAFSWHYYGRLGETENIGEDSFSHYLNCYRNVLDSYKNTEIGEKLKYMQTHLNELQTYVMSSTELYQHAGIVPTMIKLMNNVLKASDITYSNFAALIGEKTDGLSYEMINGLSYERYPAYYFMWMYGRLPVWKAKVNIADKDLLYYSGVDDGRCGLILCNNSNKTKNLNIKFSNLPFEKINATAYLADDTHKTHTSSNTPFIYARNEDLDTNNGVTLNIDLEPYGTLYCEFNNADGTLSELDNYANLGDFVRSDYFYNERGDNKPYSFFQQNSFANYIGMASSDIGQTYHSMLIKNVCKESFEMDYETLGEFVTMGGVLGFRIDYQSEDKRFKKSTIYTMEDFTGSMSTPFSEDTKPTKLTFPHVNKGKTQIMLKQYAPSDWNNTVRITCFIKNTGANTSVKFRVI